MKLIRFQRPQLWDWSGFDHWSNVQQEINRLLESPLSGRGPEFFNQWAPPLDVYEDKNSLIVKAELPGFKKEELDISLHQGTLSISGERRTEHKEGESSRSESFFGRFQRTFTLPKPVDGQKVSASYVDGILTITLPKTEESKPKQIEVKVN
jgi:HSP20 family protein